MSKNKKLYASIATICLVWGLVSQLLMRFKTTEGPLIEAAEVMSFGMVIFFPFCAGLLTLSLASESQQRSWAFRIFAPWPPTILGLLTALAVGWEGFICFLFATVMFLPLCSLGGIIAGITLSRKNNSKKLQVSVTVLALLLPMTSAKVEEYFEFPTEWGEAHTSIQLQGSPEKVWNEISSVRQITEPLDGFFYRIGFPKPIEATISYPGQGAVRNAVFERGLIFRETVDVWEPYKRLSFYIDVDAQSVPTTTLDPHVVVGGQYFDVERGTYEIEQIAEDRIILHLSSRYRVSTRFNFYASPLANLLMSDIQNTILKVIKLRVESQTNKENVW